MAKKLRYTVPAEQKTTGSLRLGLELHEADAHSRAPGELFGSLTLIDESGNVVYSLPLSPTDFAPIKTAVATIKRRGLQQLGAVEFEAEEEEPEEEAAPEAKS